MYFEIIIYVITLSLVVFAARGFLKAITANVRYADTGVVYSVRARRYARNYKAVAWGIMLFFLLVSFWVSFVEVFLSF